MRFAIVLAVVLIARIPSPAAAQSSGNAPAPFRLDSAVVDSLSAIFNVAEDDRSYLRLTTASQSVYSGYVFRVEPDSQWVHVGAVRAMYPSLERIERRHKEGTGALIGMALGAAVLGIAGYNAPSECYVLDDDRRLREVSCIAGWPIGVAGALLGSMAGALVGVVIDPGSTRWEEVWRAED